VQAIISAEKNLRAGSLRDQEDSSSLDCSTTRRPPIVKHDELVRGAILGHWETDRPAASSSNGNCNPKRSTAKTPREIQLPILSARRLRPLKRSWLPTFDGTCPEQLAA